MRLLCLLAIAVLCASCTAEEWSWAKKDGEKDSLKTEDPTSVSDSADSKTASSEGEEASTVPPVDVAGAAQGRSLLSGADLVDDILESGREGRALEGYRDVYNDPSVQDAIQSGNETSARSYIQERLCNLGLSSCDEENPSRSVQPQDLIYAQPVHIKPVGRPIAALPVRNPHAIRPYGPPRPMPLPGRPSYSSYGPPSSHPPSHPPGPYYPGAKVPPPPVYEVPGHSDTSPYAFESGFKKKQGAYVEPQPVGSANLQQHVHHHFHHAGGALGNPSAAAVRPVIESSAVGISEAAASYSPSSSYTPGPVYPPLNQQAFYKKELNLKAPIGNSLTGSGASLYSQPQRYPTNNYGSGSLGAGGDCYCVPVDQCPAHEILRKEDAASLIDPRNAPGAAAIEALDDVVITDGNGTIISHHVKRQKSDDSEEPQARDASAEGEAKDKTGDSMSSRRRRRETADASVNNDNSGVQGRDVGLGLSAAANSANEGVDEEAAASDTQESSGRALPDDEDAQGRQRTFGTNGGINNGQAQVQPTFGVSFGLPAGGNGLYPLAAQGPYPFGNPGLAGGGLDLGPVSVNPLLSVQVTKDQYGSKVVKPFVNLHVTPNAALVHKFIHGFHKPLFKHDHYHKHYIHHKYHHKPHYFHKPHYYPSYAPHYHGYKSDDVIGSYGPGPISFSPHGPIIPHGPPISSGPVVTGGYGLTYDQPDFEFKHPAGGYISDEVDLSSQPQPGEQYAQNPGYGQDYAYGQDYGYGQNYGYDQNYGYGDGHGSGGVYSQGDAEVGHFRSSYNRSLSFPEDGATSDPPRPPVTSDPLPLMAKSDHRAAPSKPVQFPSDRRSDRLRRQTEERQYYGAPGNLGAGGRCGPRMVCCRRPGRVGRPAQQLRGQCGRRQAQGINGRIKNPTYVDGDSEFGEYPWQVAILKKDPNESVYVCGGTLIDSVHIITAAHCVKSYTGHDLRVRLGEWDVNHDVEFYPHVERDVAVVTVHPEFYAGTLYNDIAVLRLVSPVDLVQSPHVSPACLPERQADFAGSRCWTTGWGKDAFGDHGKYQNVLKEVDVPVMGHQQCQQQLQQTRLGYDFRLHQGFICAGGEEGKDACKGDGGGPMVCERGGVWFVVGVVSWGVGCGQYGVPGVYVKVAHYLDWIRQVTNRY